MSSIGPQLPPHLNKRKRTPEDEGQDEAPRRPSSPPAKTRRPQESVANRDEIGLEGSDSDDGYGPKPVLGPSMPPNSNKDEIDLADDSSSDSDTGPAAPPPAVSAQPAPPPPQQDASDPSSDSDDDDFGPALPSATASKPQIGPAMPPSADDADDTPRRDEWMLAPPTKGPFSERDPTKIRARKFASSKPGRPPPSGQQQQPSSMWTETAEEKLQRLQDSVLGRTSSTAGAQAAEGASSASRRKEEEKSRRIAANVEASRGKSLYDEHSQRMRDGKGTGKVEEEDDPSKRGFDRAKDMALGGSLGAAKRKELLNKSAGFGDRFQKGSFL